MPIFSIIHSTIVIIDLCDRLSLGAFPILDISFNRLEVKQSTGNKLKAAYGNLGSVSISLISKGRLTVSSMILSCFLSRFDLQIELYNI